MFLAFQWLGPQGFVELIMYISPCEVTLLLLLLSHFSRVQLCATPETAAHQAPAPGILQARALEWVAISSSSAWK